MAFDTIRGLWSLWYASPSPPQENTAATETRVDDWARFYREAEAKRRAEIAAKRAVNPPRHTKLGDPVKFLPPYEAR